MRIVLRAALIVFMTWLPARPSIAQLAPECGNLANAYGPYDYTNPVHFRDKLPVVENAHFDSGVESFQGQTRKRKRAEQVPYDIDYTLRAFPNHHRALFTMVNYYQQGINKTLGPTPYTPECYFARATLFKPDDGTVRLIYGVYMHRQGKLEEAGEQYQQALLLMPESPELHYNLGLLNVDLKRYDEARKHAYKAYSLGYPLPGLRNRLERAGEWRVPAGAQSADVANDAGSH